VTHFAHLAVIIHDNPLQKARCNLWIPWISRPKNTGHQNAILDGRNAIICMAHVEFSSHQPAPNEIQVTVPENVANELRMIKRWM